MNSQDLIKYWLESSDRDLESMIKNFEAKQYTWALFIGHLSLEKLLKGIYAKVNEANPYPPKIHNLNILAEKCGLELNEKYKRILFTCNTFNISARYEDYKDEFYKKCTKEYTSEQINNIKEVQAWLKEQLI
ncbi:MAG: HEPN domain-containing protein [Clostridia bacterium]|nr:HEPN domain-containing protein [Clostridia bacterium]